MIPVQTSTETWRKNFRSLVLLALLGVCSTAAWVLAWHKSAPARDGRDFLESLRQRGVKSWWPANGRRQHWFLVYRQGTVVGWEMDYRQASANGTIGGMIRRTQDTRLSSRWRISNDIQEGDYQSQFVKLQLPHPESVEATIELRGDRLQVLQVIDRVRYSSATKIPDNYLPEGLMLPAMREVVRRQGKARYEMVADDHPPSRQDGGTTPLFSFQLRYLGADASTGGAMVETFYGAGEPLITILDADGEVIRRRQGNTDFQPATREAILQLFPEAAQYAMDNETVEL
ncbi:MAG: hypothetical protein JXA11_13835 [Phycisphaerae bacterium]|nr:hypothetical protein [Phycisphaerae bacterium]